MQSEIAPGDRADHCVRRSYRLTSKKPLKQPPTTIWRLSALQRAKSLLLKATFRSVADSDLRKALKLLDEASNADAHLC
jgi:hypothetical protein